MLAQEADIYLINHDGIKVIMQELAARDDIDLVIIDESGTVRNASTDRWKALKHVTVGKKAVWANSGTPTPNAPTDAWAQCRLICPENVPPYFGKFKEHVMRQVNQFKWVAREDATDTVFNAMQPAIRFSRADCVDLPPCVIQTRHVPLSPEQKKVYNDMLNKLAMEHEGEKVLAVNEAVKVQKLVQIACGVVYGEDHSRIHVFAKPRLDVVKEIIEEAGTKVIVFVPFKGVLSYVAAELAKTFSVATISGDTPKAERDSIFHSFQQEVTPRIIVASPGTMSHGLTLTAASTVIWFAPINSNDTMEQANARVSRPGQKHKQLIVNIEGTEVERRIYSRLKGKQKMQGLLLDLVRER
jgi:SNF2 family DNA or RNA helicase